MRAWWERWRVGRAALRAIGTLAILGGACTALATGEQPDVVDGAVAYPEGPVFYRGRLHYVEYSAGTVRRLDPSGPVVWWHSADCGPSGLAVYGDHLVVACYDANVVLELDETGREVARFDHDQTGQRFRGPNDFAADGRGGLYFSASGDYDVRAPIEGAVLHLSAAGGVRRLADTVHYPNGLTLDATGRHLLVAEMLAGRILSFPVETDGSLGVRSVWARLDDIAPATPGADAYNGPDGLKLGPDEHLYVAQNGSGRVLVVDAQRHLVRAFTVPAPYVTNVGFGPSGECYVTATFDEWHAPYPGVVYRLDAAAAR
jgi:gluconolactonase